MTSSRRTEISGALGCDVVASCPFGVVLTDMEFRIVLWNAVMAQRFDTPEAGQVGRDLRDVIPALAGEAFAAWLARLAEADAPMSPESDYDPGILEVRDARGLQGSFRITGRRTETADGRRLLVFWFQDESEHLSTSANLRAVTAELRDTAERLQSAVTRGELIHHETHHRVKNILAMITSLMSIYADRFGDNEARRRYEELTLRVRSIALVYDQLHLRNGSATVDLGPYLVSLLDTLMSFRGTGDCAVDRKACIDDGACDIDTAIPLGLIVSEIVTNSLEHGFTGRSKGRISVTTERLSTEYHICIADDGIGMPATASNHRGLGLMLIDSLSRQIDAEITRRADDGGTRYDIVVPRSDPVDHGDPA